MSIIRTSLIGLTLAAALAAGQPATAQAATAAAPAPKDPAVQKALDRLVAEDGFPGAMAAVRDSKGRVRSYTAGVGSLRTKAPLPPNGRVRIASNTKMFTATVILQLVGEGRISLDQPVERYLPGVVRGHGNDGRRITVRMLLQQTSGLPDYDTIVTDGGGSLGDVAHTYFGPRQLVDAALSEKREFAPGTRWSYSNTNYVLLGLVAERVAGRPIGEQITRRIIKPLRLTDTYWPGVGEQRIRGRHPQGYLADKPGAPWKNVTTMDPSLGWAAGQLVSTPRDLNRFMTSLLDGRLLRPAQLAQMRTTVKAPGFEPTKGWRYGLGLARHAPGCGVVGWGHGGDIQGFESRNLATRDGRAATVVVTGLPTSVDQVEHVSRAVDTALCAVD
jgi:D-alanyl-D-alanine carboxypeptidase